MDEGGDEVRPHRGLAPNGTHHLLPPSSCLLLSSFLPSFLSDMIASTCACNVPHYHQHSYTPLRSCPIKEEFFITFNRATLNWYKDTEHFGAFKGADLLPSGRNWYLNGFDGGTLFLDNMDFDRFAGLRGEEEPHVWSVWHHSWQYGVVAR
jgi:hypothetical protein